MATYVRERMYGIRFITIWEAYRDKRVKVLESYNLRVVLINKRKVMPDIITNNLNSITEAKNITLNVVCVEVKIKTCLF